MNGHRPTWANRDGMQSAAHLAAQPWSYRLTWHYARPLQAGRSGSMLVHTIRDAKTELLELLTGFECLTSGFAQILDLTDGGRAIAHYAGTPAQVIEVLTAAAQPKTVTVIDA